ncbi:MAG: L-seryl-tRNA(Sec) selenium transferase [Actinomycetota bacterium]
MTAPRTRPPSVNALAQRLAGRGIPHPILVDLARQAIADDAIDEFEQRAANFSRALLTPVINATGVLLHTNLGRAPNSFDPPVSAITVEFDLATGERGSRQHAVGSLFARLCQTEAAMVVNNNAAAVLLVLAALAEGRDVPVSRGESVEIGGSFRVPDVMEQSGARLIDVGTTNRTRLDDYRRAVARDDVDAALVLKVHPSNYRIDGFVEDTSVADLATLDVPVVADIGSGLIDADCPWLSGPPPAWLADEPAAVQSLRNGAALVMFSGDKLLGGPQAGIIAGRRDLVEPCMRHPLARALRPGGLVLHALQSLALAYLERDVVAQVPFWTMAAAPTDSLEHRATAIVDTVAAAAPGTQVIPTQALPGAGSAPGVTIPSWGVELDMDVVDALRARQHAIIARRVEDRTVLDLRSVQPADDSEIAQAIIAVSS